MTSPAFTPTPSAIPASRDRLGRIVAASLATGLVAALLLVAAPFVPAREDVLTGAVLIGFAAGWAMLVLLSARFTAAPQRWAAAPAVFMGLGGLLLAAFGPSARTVLDWVWPPALLLLTVWVTARVRRMPSRGGRRLLYPVLAVLALASIGAGYETAAEAVDAHAHPMPGQLVDVGGHRLHLSCTGSGGPTVVLEPGGGEMGANLGWITPAVAGSTHVCVYDRAGRGWSEPADAPQDGARIAADLHTLLHRAGVPGPYVLAGHSFGGLYVLAFANRYPGEVAGMVLVDSTAPAASATADGPGALRRISALTSVAARFGLGRLYAQTSYGDLPAQSRDEVRAGIATASTLRSTIDEYVQASASVREAAALHDLGNKPLVVLTAGAGSDAAWSAAQDRLAKLSGNAVHRVVDGATHEALMADRGYAAVTSQAIVDVVMSVRTAQPLAR
ncbi:alpha/beta fold hydrolase [Paractinoplanes globisporus]|uniref:Alpha/beta fold hydrolase n=1 Tax=Paractinoplanes globisporus TaxID=113565 RepID=A0ABW6WRM1_9ACTN|nr:alpha/beta hydrolase [Actinoplanes globisporus]